MVDVGTNSKMFAIGILLCLSNHILGIVALVITTLLSDVLITMFR